MGQAGTFVVLIGQFSAIYGNKSDFEISKIRLFQHFGAILSIFDNIFFHNESFIQNRSENTQNESSGIL